MVIAFCLWLRFYYCYGYACSWQDTCQWCAQSFIVDLGDDWKMIPKLPLFAPVVGVVLDSLAGCACCGFGGERRPVCSDLPTPAAKLDVDQSLHHCTRYQPDGRQRRCF